MILRYAREALTAHTPELVVRVAAYRGGYLAEERRALEQALFSGQLVGLTTTYSAEALAEAHLVLPDLAGITLVGLQDRIPAAGEEK